MMISLAEEALRDVEVDPGAKNKPHFRRFLRRDPIGVVLVIAPWNYPFLTAVNSIVPAILAGKRADGRAFGSLAGMADPMPATWASSASRKRCAAQAFETDTAGGREIHRGLQRSWAPQRRVPGRPRTILRGTALLHGCVHPLAHPLNQPRHVVGHP